jgi:hypothetical protein
LMDVGGTIQKCKENQDCPVCYKIIREEKFIVVYWKNDSLTLSQICLLLFNFDISFHLCIHDKCISRISFNWRL